MKYHTDKLTTYLISYDLKERFYKALCTSGVSTFLPVDPIKQKLYLKLLSHAYCKVLW